MLKTSTVRFGVEESKLGKQSGEGRSNLALLFPVLDFCVNDPSAGSPTETLLRLLLPLNGKV